MHCIGGFVSYDSQKFSPYGSYWHDRKQNLELSFLDLFSCYVICHLSKEWSTCKASRLATDVWLQFALLCFAVEYMAPEVVTRSPGYTKPADWWSYGIFTFDLLTGRSPFHSNRGKQETKERILRGKFHTPAFLTPMAQDLIRRLLRRPVDKRLGSKGGAQEVKNHEFFNGICWEKVLKREYQPPFVPSLANAEDVSNFDTRFTSKSPRESNESPVGQSSGISRKNSILSEEKFC